MWMNSSAYYGSIKKQAKFDFGQAMLPLDTDVADKPQNSIIGGATLWVLKGHDQDEKNNKEPRNIRRVLGKDVIPAIGKKHLTDVTVSDILVITDRIKARGADQSALMTRNVLKRMFAYAIAREKAISNPAAAVEARYIARAKSRDVALTPDEKGGLVWGFVAMLIALATIVALVVFPWGFLYDAPESIGRGEGQRPFATWITAFSG